MISILTFPCQPAAFPQPSERALSHQKRPIELISDLNVQVLVPDVITFTFATQSSAIKDCGIMKLCSLKVDCQWTLEQLCYVHTFFVQ